MHNEASDMQLHAAADLSDAALGGVLGIEDGRFVDGFGRTVMLRGWNVSGASKLPTTPNGLSHLTEGFYEHRTVTFIGRPFPLEEAPLHFRRLQAWGMPFIRLLVTWESLAHAGPDPDADLDLEYIAYLRRLVELMPQYGIKCFVCAHQDVWSRFSGGSGAPGWTFEAAGLDVEAFTDTGAAYVHGQDELRRSRAPVNEKEPSGPFVWPSGYQKLAASTMATLFWAGDALAPQLRCWRSSMHRAGGEAEEVSVQDFLQDSFVESFGRLADAMADLEACIGFEPVNEPHRGLVNLHGFHGWNYDTDLHIGFYPSLAQALALGSGYAQTVPYYVKSWPFPTRISHQSLVDPGGRSAWLPAGLERNVNRPRGMGQCVWRAHGAWNWDAAQKKAVVLQPDYFEYDHRPGRETTRIEWYRDCYAPFLHRFAERVSRNAKRQFCLVEPIPNEFMPPWPSAPNDRETPVPQNYAVPTVLASQHRPRNLVFAPHFYDLNVLFSKFHAWMSVNVQALSRGMFVLRALYFGADGLFENYREQIANIIRHGRASLGPTPVVIGEIGLPYDINDRKALLTGDYDKQRELMGGLVSAMEANLVDGFALWNYNPDNRAEYGDGWNKEDFSVVNGDHAEASGHPTQIAARPDYRNGEHENDELYQGGRVLDVVIRPYGVKIAGTPELSRWDARTLRYELRWSGRAHGHDKTGRSQQTEIFVPSYHYGSHQLRVTASNGLDWSFDAEKQTMYVRQGSSGRDAPIRHSLVLEIQNVDAHLLRRARQKRMAMPSPFPWSIVPPSFDVWGESFGLYHVLLVVFGVLLSIVTGLYTNYRA
jgi:hypothetical protein